MATNGLCQCFILPRTIPEERFYDGCREAALPTPHLFVRAASRPHGPPPLLAARSIDAAYYNAMYNLFVLQRILSYMR